MATATIATDLLQRRNRQNYVVFLRAPGGKIVFLREYFDPVRAAKEAMHEPRVYIPVAARKRRMDFLGSDAVASQWRFALGAWFSRILRDVHAVCSQLPSSSWVRARKQSGTGYASTVRGKKPVVHYRLIFGRRPNSWLPCPAIPELKSSRRHMRKEPPHETL